MTCSIGKASEVSGFGIHTLRFYERKNLIRPRRDDAGRRRYSDEDLERLAIIKNFKKIGTPLCDIEGYFRLIDLKEEGIPARRALLLSEKGRIRERIEELQEAARFIDEVIVRCGLSEQGEPSGPQPPP